jgi:hypothetical protein
LHELYQQVNSVGIKKAIAMIENEPRGSWAFICAYNNEGNEEMAESVSKGK